MKLFREIQCRRVSVVFSAFFFLCFTLRLVSGKIDADVSKIPKLNVVAKFSSLSEFGLSKNVPALPIEKEQSTVRSFSKAMRIPVTALSYLVLASESTGMGANCLKVHSTVIIAAVNIAVHTAWTMARIEKDVKLFRFLNRNFVLHSDDLAKGRVHTILLAAFSHKCEIHLTSNLSALLLFGPKIAKNMGNRVFSYFYVAAIYASDLFDQMIYSKFHRKYIRVLFWKLPIGSLGASGAISAVLAYSCFKYPHERYAVSESGNGPEGKLSIPAWAVLIMQLLSDLFPTKDSGVGHGAHLGGYIFGTFVYMLNRLWKAFVSARRQSERNAVKQWFASVLPLNIFKKRELKDFYENIQGLGKKVSLAWDKLLDHVACGVETIHTVIVDELRFQMELDVPTQWVEERADLAKNYTNATKILDGY